VTLNLSPSFKRRYGPSAEAVAARLSATYGHLAVAVAAELYDEAGELSDHGAQLMIDIRKADHARAEVIESARRMYGLGSPAYRATYDLASRQRADDYQRALERYDAANEAGDEEDIADVPALMAEAAE
jgi:hypothetical protein